MRKSVLLFSLFAAALAAYDAFYELLPDPASVYLLALVETAFAPAFLLLKPKWSPRGFANALLLFILWFFAQPLLGLLPVQSPSDVAAEIAELYREGLLPTLIVLHIAVEPIVHEVMFRGVLFEELSRLGRAPAYLTSSLAYALLLAPPLSPQLAVTAANIFLVGLILAYAYKNGGLSASILLHLIYSVIYVIYILLYIF